MFISCLHCRELVAIDRETGLAPEMCPRCGGILRESTVTGPPAAMAPSAAGRSFISFLRGHETAATTLTETTTTTGSETLGDATSADPASLERISEDSAKIETGAETTDQATADIDPQATDTSQGDAIVSDVAPVPAASAPTPITQSLPATPSFTRQSHDPARLRAPPVAMGVVDRPFADPGPAGIARRPRTACRRCDMASPDRLSLQRAGCSMPPWHQPRISDAQPRCESDRRPRRRPQRAGLSATMRLGAGWPCCCCPCPTPTAVCWGRAHPSAGIPGPRSDANGTGAGASHRSRCNCMSRTRRGRIYIRLSLTKADFQQGVHARRSRARLPSRR